MWSRVGTAYSRPSAVRTAKGTNGVTSKCLRISPVITDRSYATSASQASTPSPHPRWPDWPGIRRKSNHLVKKLAGPLVLARGSCSYIDTTLRFCPGGTNDNSPTFSTLGTRSQVNQVPKGRLKFSPTSSAHQIRHDVS